MLLEECAFEVHECQRFRPIVLACTTLTIDSVVNRPTVLVATAVYTKSRFVDAQPSPSPIKTQSAAFPDRDEDLSVILIVLYMFASIDA